jgi:negative regulator of sigma E activity
MSCERMETRILPYVDGRLKESERAEVEKHLAGCAGCRLRVHEFRSVNELLGELPQIEPSAAFDIRVHARVAAEPAKRSWWRWFAPSPRVAFAASLLLVATVWIGMRQYQNGSANTPDDSTLIQNQQVLDNMDVLSNFEPLTDLPEQPTQAAPAPVDDDGQQM